MTTIRATLRRKTLAALALLALATLVVFTQAGAANAEATQDDSNSQDAGIHWLQAADDRDAAQDPAAILGIGQGVFTTVNTASLFQCPYTWCNQGLVVNGLPSGHPDDVGAICHLWVGDNHWALVLNHANNNVGFIGTGYLVPQGSSAAVPYC